MQESGSDSGSRNIGRFFLFAIPAVLGIAASIWLGVYIDAHNFNHQETQEQRAAVAVGAAVRPASKIDVKIVDRRECVKIASADLDGSTLTIIAKSSCHRDSDYLEYHWEQLSPDGTAIHAGYTNQCPKPEQGGKAECVFEHANYKALPEDDRVASIRVWVEYRP